MDTVQRDRTIVQILRGELAVPIEVLAASIASDPDTLAIRFIDTLADGPVSAETVNVTRVAAVMHPEHTLLRLVALAARESRGNDPFRCALLANLASDSMLAEIDAKVAA